MEPSPTERSRLSGWAFVGGLGFQIGPLPSASVQRWSSPLSFDAVSTARLVRESMDALGWRYEATTAERQIERVVLAIALPRAALAHRFRVRAPVDVEIETFDSEPTPGGLLPILEVKAFVREDEAHLRDLLAEVARRAPRPPWRFSFGQRLSLGLLSSAPRRARRAWRAWRLA